MIANELNEDKNDEWMMMLMMKNDGIMMLMKMMHDDCYEWLW